MLINFFPSKSLMSSSLSALQHYLSDFFHQLYVASSCCMHTHSSLVCCHYPLSAFIMVWPNFGSYWLLTAPQIRFTCCCWAPIHFIIQLYQKSSACSQKKQKKTCMDHFYGVISTDELPIYFYFFHK